MKRLTIISLILVTTICGFAYTIQDITSVWTTVVSSSPESADEIAVTPDYISKIRIPKPLRAIVNDELYYAVY